MRSILKDLDELLEAGILDEETAQKIEAYYEEKDEQAPNRVMAIFGIIGSLLVGLGLVLIIAHNWDELSRWAKTLLVFIPLIVAQILSGYALLKKQGDMAWREGTASFQFLALGFAISLIGQIYNVPGDVGTYMLSWMALGFAIMYVQRSYVVSLLYVLGISYYALHVGYVFWGDTVTRPYLYWPMLLLVLPQYYILYKKQPQSNFMLVHNWALAFSLILCLGTLVGLKGHQELMFVAYASLLGILISLGNAKFLPQGNGLSTIGELGTIFILILLSFRWFWTHYFDLYTQHPYDNPIFASNSFWVSIVLSLLALIFLIGTRLQGQKPQNPIMSFAFLLIIPLFVIGAFDPILPIILSNLFTLGLGIATIWIGAQKNSLAILNFGLCTIAVLIISRFFDVQMSFILRGSLFIAVGIGFFAANYWMMQKRKTTQEQ